MDTVRVLRIIEYIGPRDKVEKQVANSVHGTKNWGNGVTINVATLGTFPEILVAAMENESVVGEVPDGA